MIAARPTPSRRLPATMLAAVLPCLLALAPASRADDTPSGSTAATAPTAPADRKAERAADRKEAREKKDKKDAKVDKQRALIESGAKTAPQWYAEALARYEKGRYQDARAILLPLEDSPRASDIQEQVKLLLADAYFYNGGDLNLSEALARYRSFLTFYPGSAKADYAQFQIGECYFLQLGRPDRDQSYTDNGIREYQRVVDVYPDSPYAAKAKGRADEAKARRARHEFAVGKYYYDWSQYAAAAQRFGEMVKERPESPDREEAIALAADSLYRLGRRAEADAYSARLAQDYPNSKWKSHVSSGGTDQKELERVARRERTREKDLSRTEAHAERREEHRTRIIRKDSGLPSVLPPQPVRTELEKPAAAETAAGDAATPVHPVLPAANAPPVEEPRTLSKAKAHDVAKAARLAKDAAADEKHREKLEAEEQADAARTAAREKAVQDKQSREADKEKAEAAAHPERAAREEAKAKERADKAEAKEKARQEKAEKKEQDEARRKAKKSGEPPPPDKPPAPGTSTDSPKP